MSTKKASGWEFVGAALILIVLTLLLTHFTSPVQSQELTYSAQFTIKETTLPHEGKEIRNFELRSADGGAFLVMGDEDVPFIQELILRKNTKVRLTLTKYALQELKR